MWGMRMMGVMWMMRVVSVWSVRMMRVMAVWTMGVMRMVTVWGMTVWTVCMRVSRASRSTAVGENRVSTNVLTMFHGSASFKVRRHNRSVFWRFRDLHDWKRIAVGRHRSKCRGKPSIYTFALCLVGRPNSIEHVVDGDVGHRRRRRDSYGVDVGLGCNGRLVWIVSRCSGDEKGLERPIYRCLIVQVSNRGGHVFLEIHLCMIDAKHNVAHIRRFPL